MHELTLYDIASAIARQIERAPAGGPFTSAEVGSRFDTVHADYANETVTFRIKIGVRLFAISVEELSKLS